MRHVLRRSAIRRYDFVFISSSVFAERHFFYGLFVDFLRFVPRGRYGYLLVEHNLPSLRQALSEKRIEHGRLFLLSDYQDDSHVVPMLNPHYFGIVTRQPQANVRRFVSVGAVTSRNRNFTMLLEAVRELEREGAEPFEVVVVGNCTEGAILRDFPASVYVRGYLDFPRLYDELERASFFLPLLDPSCESHRRYLAGETTGSRQLILGFGLVPVIDEVFASAYSFDESSAVLYSGGMLVAGMRSALSMDSAAYERRRERVSQLADSVYARSLRNLYARISAVAPGIMSGGEPKCPEHLA